jgi:hypothetical protein
VYLIVLLIMPEKSWIFLTICVYDSSVDNIREELNVHFPEIVNRIIIYTNRQEHSTLSWYSKYYYHIRKSSKTFNSSLKLSTELSYTQINKSIQLFSDIINKTLVSENSWRFLTICVYDSSVDNLWEELNDFDDLRIW